MDTFLHRLRLEGRELYSRLGGTQSILIHAVLLAAFGGFLPWRKGLDFLDPLILTAYACLGVLFAAPASAQAFAVDAPGSVKSGSMETVLARIAAAVAYGEGMGLAMLLGGLVTVGATHGRLLLPPLDVLALGIALGLSASFALASVAAWITLRFSPGAARGAMRVIFLLLLLAFFFRARWLPDVAGTGTLICIAVTGVALFALQGLTAGRGEVSP